MILLSLLPGVGWVVEVLLLYLALGLRSLGEHLVPVALALRQGDLAEARRLAADMASIDPAFLAQYKALIDEGYAASFGEGLAMEHRLSSAANSAVSPEEVEARRAAVQQRGRTQG